MKRPIHGILSSQCTACTLTKSNKAHPSRYLHGLVFVHRLLGNVVHWKVTSIHAHSNVYGFPARMLAAAAVSVELQQVRRFGNVQTHVIPQLKILHTHTHTTDQNTHLYRCYEGCKLYWKRTNMTLMTLGAKDIRFI